MKRPAWDRSHPEDDARLKIQIFIWIEPHEDRFADISIQVLRDGGVKAVVVHGSLSLRFTETSIGRWALDAKLIGIGDSTPKPWARLDTYEDFSLEKPPASPKA